MAREKEGKLTFSSFLGKNSDLHGFNPRIRLIERGKGRKGKGERGKGGGGK
jgi:hypothetical protein